MCNKKIKNLNLVCIKIILIKKNQTSLPCELEVLTLNQGLF